MELAVGLAAVGLALAAFVSSTPSTQAAYIGEAKGSGLVTAVGLEEECGPFGCFLQQTSVDEGSFGFQVTKASETDPGSVDLRATNRANGDRIRWVSGAVAFGLNYVQGQGICEVDGQSGTCSFSAQDYGEPGENDYFCLFYDSPGGAGQMCSQLLSGNIEIETT